VGCRALAVCRGTSAGSELHGSNRRECQNGCRRTTGLGEIAGRGEPREGVSTGRSGESERLDGPHSARQLLPGKRKQNGDGHALVAAVGWQVREAIPAISSEKGGRSFMPRGIVKPSPGSEVL